ncbi:MAG: adenylosuccinate synthetase [Eubacterium sp.]
MLLQLLRHIPVQLVPDEFVSEIFGDEADELRKRGGDGGEFGATTGRPRRMGWFDAVASRYGCQCAGCDRSSPDRTGCTGLSR